MALSPRQLELIQGAARVLVSRLNLLHDEAVELIAAAMRKELAAKHTSMDILQVSSRAERTAFVRAAVADVEEQLLMRRTWQPQTVRGAVTDFMQILHDSWDTEG